VSEHVVAPQVDVDSLPPTQYLILDVLAARYRMGEQVWTFRSDLRPAIVALAKLGLVNELNGITPKSVRARLTNAGQVAVLLDGYEAPEVKRLRANLRTVARYAEDTRDGGVADQEATLRSIAELARRAAEQGGEP
jgi:hypothetical protein